MLRVAGLACVAVAVMAASPPRPAVSPWNAPLLAQATLGAAEPDAVAAAQPSTTDSGAYTAAPVPDADQAAPTAAARAPGEAEVTPNLFSNHGTYRGEGFTPGSSVQASERRNISPAPGVSLNVPLE